MILDCAAMYATCEPVMAELSNLATQPGLYHSAELAQQVIDYVLAMDAPTGIDRWMPPLEGLGLKLAEAAGVEAG